MMVLGREVKSPLEVVMLANLNKVAWPSAGEYVSHLRERLYKAHQVARDHLKTTANRQKAKYDAKASHHNYVAGAWYGY